ncbi:MAG: helix-turn-helix domain-containing protein [Candidatus Heimdallarchaeota archaeon]
MHKCLINLPDTLLNGGKCDIFECLFGLKPLHVKIYFYTLKQGKTIKDIATHVNRERTTAVRLVQNMIEQGLIHKKPEQLAYGGTRNVYTGVPQKIIKNRLRVVVKEVETAMKNLIKQDWQLIPD